MKAAPRLGAMRWSIRVVRRAMVEASLYSAEVDHEYTTVLTTRAACTTHSGLKEFNRVTTASGTAPTHTFAIRFTTIPIDIRDRVIDTLGNLYQILSVDPVDNNRRWMNLHCAQLGSQDRASIS
mgnify:CR=1 FL=1